MTNTISTKNLTVPSSIEDTIQNQLNSPSDLARLYLFDRIKALPIPKFLLGKSIRFWLRVYEQEAKSAGLENLDDCARGIGTFIPEIITNWLYSQPPTVRGSGKLCSEALILQFGLPVEQETNSLIRQLKQLKQQPKESMRQPTAKFYHLVQQLPDKHLNENDKCLLFIKPILSESTRFTLSAAISYKLDTMIQQAVRIQENGFIGTVNTALDTATDTEVTPMEIDYMNKKRKKTEKTSGKTNKNSTITRNRRYPIKLNTYMINNGDCMTKKVTLFVVVALSHIRPSIANNITHINWFTQSMRSHNTNLIWSI